MERTYTIIVSVKEVGSHIINISETINGNSLLEVTTKLSLVIAGIARQINEKEKEEIKAQYEKKQYIEDDIPF